MYSAYQLNKQGDSIQYTIYTIYTIYAIYYSITPGLVPNKTVLLSLAASVVNFAGIQPCIVVKYIHKMTNI